MADDETLKPTIVRWPDRVEMLFADPDTGITSGYDLDGNLIAIMNSDGTVTKLEGASDGQS